MTLKTYIILILILISCNTQKNSVLRIASASSLRPVLEELIITFSKLEQVKIELITASSGKLASQIEVGAPYDIFFSANKKYSTYVKAKLHLKDSIKTFAKGKLALLVSKKKNTHCNLLQALKQQNIKRIAIANPKLAPYGMASLELFQNLSIKATLSSKIVYGENISQVNQFLKSNAVDAGLTAFSTLKSIGFKEEYYKYEIPASLHQPIFNTTLILSKNTTQHTQAEKFVSYLQTTPAKRILVSYGYDVSK